MKTFAKRVASRSRYYRRLTSPDEKAARAVPDARFYTRWTMPSPLFTPWTGHPEFEALFDGVAAHTVVSRDRCYILARLAQNAVHLDGDFAECGVYKGGTALLLARVMAGSGKRLRLFDSFEGLPAGKGDEDRWFSEGDFAVDGVDSVARVLGDYDFTEIRKGWIPETFDGLEDNAYAFAHLDVDLYQSTLDSCEYFHSRLVAGGILLFDEYGFPAARGERMAVDEFFSDKLESPVALPTGQAMVIKLPEVR